MTRAADPASHLKRRLASLPARLRFEANAALRQIGDETVAEIRRLLAANNGAQPSAPGAPPRDLKGRLADTLTANLDESAATVTVEAASPEALFLEYGTRTMAARPFLRPSAEAVRPIALDTLRAALARAARQDGGSAE